LVDRLVTGRSAGPDDIVDRLRIIPLPSIGHEHADRLIRRLLVDIPQTSPLRPEAINWALEGQELSLSANGPKVLIAGSAEDAVTQRYLAQSSRYWRSVTPIALFRRDKKSLIQALRQAGLDAQLDKATLRREPLTKKGRYSTDYVHGTRFGPERTVHATLRFNMPIYGPVLIGDGRFLGLGLFEPFEPGADDCWAFAFDKALPLSAHVEVARQFRRALMARVQAQLGGKELPPVISGHEPDGRPLRGGVHRHLFYRAMVEDGELRGIEVMAPHLVAGGGTAAAWTNHKGCIDEALASFSNLHYGGANVELAPATSDRPSASLRLASVTRYVTTRRPRLADDRTEFLKADIKNEAFRCNLKLAGEPQMSGPKLEATGRLSAHVELRLIEGCKYHVMLGASSHYAGGAFEGCE
jgi:CRISPR-associated protein Csb2